MKNALFVSGVLCIGREREVFVFDNKYGVFEGHVFVFVFFLCACAFFPFFFFQLIVSKE